jgi:impB/mucB/samB family
MWVPELPFQLACLSDAGLRERPLAFLSSQGGRTPCLWLLNRAAKAEGLQAGDPMDTALRCVRSLRVLDPQPHTWWSAQEHLGEFLQRWSPQGQLGRMGEALLELHGTDRLHGSPQDAAQKIRRELARIHGWESRGGLSESATAAAFASRLAQDIEGIPEGSESNFLAPQPIPRLPDLHPRLRFRFHRLGLRKLGDLQVIPVATLMQLMKPDQAPRFLQRVRGEDRIRLPLLTEPQGRSSHRWRLEPPRLPEEVPLARWALEQLWRDPRSPRSLRLRWWDVDGVPHHWHASPEDLLEPPLVLAPRMMQAFCALATRRLLVHRLELSIRWGLGQSVGLFQSESSQRLGRLERTLAKLRRRFPEQWVLPGWTTAEASP